MAAYKHKEYSCLICAAFIPIETVKQVDKLNVIFLLQILLGIPQENKLVENIQNSIDSIQICDHCTKEIKQCKEIYREICDKIKRFWECRNNLLEKVSKDLKTNRKNTTKDSNSDLIFQCRKFIKEHDISGFQYPFTVHNLETLLTYVPSSPQQLPDPVKFVPKSELPLNTPENYVSLHMSEDSFAKEIPSPSEQDGGLHVKQEPESEEDAADIQNDDDYKVDDEDDQSDNDSDYQPSPSKKPKLSPSKRKSTLKSTKRVKVQKSKIKTRSNRKMSDHYPNFRRDPTTKKFHCTWSADCSRQFGDIEYIGFHWDRHQGTPRQKCEECPQAFFSRRELTGHKQAEHPKEGDNFDCDKCEKKYKTREALLGHQRTYHDEKKEEKRKAQLNKKEEDPIKRDPITNKWICWWPDCGKMYLERTDLNFHLDRHRGTPQKKCGVCGELFYSRGQLVYHKEKEHEKDTKFDCEICGDKFDTKSGLYQHKTFRHSEKGTGVEVVCQICGKTYKKNVLYLHVKYVHGKEEERKFACHLCPASFTNLTVLKRHLWGIHEYCEREEDKEMFMKQKEKVREKGYNWRCHVKGCRVRFVTEDGLKKHVDGVHKGKWGEEEDTDFKLKCEICGKGFHVKQKLMRHLKQHEKEKQ